MPDLSQRSYEPEMLDLPVKDRGELLKSLNEISLINKLLGGDRVTIKGLAKLIVDRERKYRIVDIGCGDGGLLRRVNRWAVKEGLKAEFLGIDIDAEAIAHARAKNKEHKNIRFLTTGYEDYFDGLNHTPDIVISTLFCHHLGDDQLGSFIDAMVANTNVGFVINDLHRHPLAYYSIKWLTRIFCKSSYTKNDAPLSVAKGFKKKELKSLLNAFHSLSYEINWQWAFRFLVVAKAEENGYR